MKKGAVVFKNSDVADKNFSPVPWDHPERKKATEKLDKLVAESRRVILDVQSVFPFKFFPDEIIIDETKVSFFKRYFFYTAEIRSIEYKDMFNVIVDSGLFFAKLEISDRFYSKQPLSVEFLTKKDALQARRIIQGLMIAAKEGIDFHLLPLNELVEKVDRVGQLR